MLTIFPIIVALPQRFIDVILQLLKEKMGHKIIILMLLTQALVSCSKSKSDNKTESIEGTHTFSFPSNTTSEKRNPLLVSDDYGVSWKAATENLPEDIQVSFLEQKNDEMVLASDNMGVFMSTNNKSKWKSIGNELPNKKINALHINNQDIYVGVYQKGIFRTKNEGQTWESLNRNLRDLNIQSIYKLDTRLLVGSDKGIYIVDDDTDVWKETNIKSQVLSIYEYDNKLVAGTSQGTLISEDKGNHWISIRNEGSVHYTHNIGNRIIELMLNGDIVYSDDWGENWNQTEYGPRNGSYVYEIIESGDYQLMSNNYGVHRSNDKGKSWVHIFKTESMVFFDLISIGDKIYGGTRDWDEYRKR